MQLHLVGGFLGSGKTTAIVAAAKHLLNQGKKVGVITNDQGKFLVDTSFFKLENVPAVEVSGGCFCCNYDKFDQGVATLVETIQPDVIFAESVGSCADIVATVMRPLLQFSETKQFQTTLSIFVDARLLEIHLSGDEMPFQEGIVYIFRQQIEEANLIVINKIDLLSNERKKALKEKFQLAYPSKQAIMQSSLIKESTLPWLIHLEGSDSLPKLNLQLDYLIYGAAEQNLAWYDAKIVLSSMQPLILKFAIRLIEDMETRIRQNDIAIGHLKFLVEDSEHYLKLSITALPGKVANSVNLNEQWLSPITMTINARAACPVNQLQFLIRQSYRQMEFDGCSVQILVERAFHPDIPKPTHWMI